MREDSPSVVDPAYYHHVIEMIAQAANETPGDLFGTAASLLGVVMVMSDHLTAVERTALALRMAVAIRDIDPHVLTHTF